jgi:hypothetical protein
MAKKRHKNNSGKSFQFENKIVKMTKAALIAKTLKTNKKTAFDNYRKNQDFFF